MGFDFFTPAAPAVIGLDVDDSAIRMVELSRNKRGICLERYAIEPLPQGAIFNHKVADVEAVHQALVVCRKKLRSRVKNAAAAVSHSSIQVIRARMSQNLRDDEIDTNVMALLNDKGGISIEQNSLDYQFFEAPPGADGETGDAEMLIATCLKEKVEERVELVEAAGLKASIIDSDLFAMIDAIEQSLARQDISAEDKVVMLMHVAHSSTYFYFVRNGQVVHERELPFGTEYLSQDIGTLYGGDAQTGDRIRLGLKTVEDTGPLEQAKETFVEMTAQEAQRAIQLFFNTTNYSIVHSVILLGNGIGLPNMVDTMDRVLSVSCQIGNPFAGMMVGHDVDSRQLFMDAPALAVACGLALRRFDK